MKDCDWARVFQEMDDPADAWNSRVIREGLSQEAAEWLDGARAWSVFFTLTFRDGPLERLARQKLQPGKTWSRNALTGTLVTEEHAERLFRRLNFELNKAAFGKHYTDKVGHGYSSYAWGLERQGRGVLHIHGVFDQPIDCRYAEYLWYQWAGISRFEPVRDPAHAVSYILKEIKHGADLCLPYLAKTTRVPSPLPAWWTSRSFSEPRTSPHSQLTTLAGL